MAEQPAPIPIHPVASRVKDGANTPHVGPHIHAYRAAHAETVGHESDKWWAKVRDSLPHTRPSLSIARSWNVIPGDPIRPDVNDRV